MTILPLTKYILVALISMVPIIELRGAVPIGIGMGLNPILTIIVCIIGNMLPVPFIHIFARKFLVWGAKQKYIGKICNFFVKKGEKASKKLANKKGHYGIMIALMLFVGIPLPGTGAWTGALGASFLNLDLKTTTVSVMSGIIIAGIIMATVSVLGLHIFGL